MKKIILSFLLMFSLALSFASCKKDDSPDIENTEQPTVSEDIKEEKPSEEISNTKPEEKKDSHLKGDENVSANELENLVETFNSSDNEEEKEEARKKIEDILKQAQMQHQ